VDRILYQHGGGLGDWLINSTLPELFSKQGDDFYLSSKGMGNLANQSTLDLLLCCPYIKGVSDETANVGFFDNLEVLSFREDKKPLILTDDVNIVTSREYHHNFNTRNYQPIIYYQPKFRKEFMDKVIVDFNSISGSDLYDWDVIKNYVINNLQFTYINIKDELSVDGIINYKTKDIFEYIDIIYSCRKFICLVSGGNTLVSAISRFRVKLDVDVYLPDCWDVSRPWEFGFFIFKNNYIHF